MAEGGGVVVLFEENRNLWDMKNRLPVTANISPEILEKKKILQGVFFHCYAAL